MNKLKCIILDIDGTLTDSRGKISTFTKNVIKEVMKNDIMVILASGRSVLHTVETSKECCASKMIIADNGATIYDYQNDDYLYINMFTKDQLEKAWHICLRYNIDSIYNTNDIRYRKYICLDKRFNEKNDHMIENFKDIKKGISQVVLLSKNHNNFNMCLSEIKKIGLIINNVGNGSNGIFFADVNCNNVNKGTAVNKICELLKIQKSEIMGIGNSINDLKLFDGCGVKVAMKNAVAELKRRADHITEYTNDENGVAMFLKNYMLR